MAPSSRPRKTTLNVVFPRGGIFYKKISTMSRLFPHPTHLILEKRTVEMHCAAGYGSHIDTAVVVHIVQRYFLEVRDAQGPENRRSTARCRKTAGLTSA